MRLSSQSSAIIFQPDDPILGGLMKRIYYFLILLTLLLGLQIPIQAQQETAKDEKAQSQLSERDAFRDAVRMEDPAQKLSALKKFLVDFPNSPLKPLVKMHSFKAMVDSGANEKEFLPVAEEAVSTFP